MAAFLGVHPVTVAKWVARHRADTNNGLKAKPTPGQPRFLTDAPERKVLGWLNEPPTEHGFDTDLWTARRVAELFHTTFGVRFHPNYLRERLAKQRNQSAIDRWVTEDWPRIQKGARETRPRRSDRRNGAVRQPAGPQ